MITIKARNVNDALYQGAQLLRDHGVERDSRNGPVLVAPEPVTTVYENPCERVMLHPGRDANPFFHLVESLWMLAGRSDLAALTPYVKNMANFSDDGGITQPGAYGYRWRRHFFYDQLGWAIGRLKEDPNDRRVVIQMYDAQIDQTASDNGGKDIPCNLVALPWVGVDGRLNLTVYNRSNDMVWGAYGANAVHFSVLQEFLAAAIDRPVGQYWQVSNNFHGYLNTIGKAGDEWPWVGELDLRPDGVGELLDPYSAGQAFPAAMFPRLPDLKEFSHDLTMFFENPARTGIRNGFLRQIACPMVLAHRSFRVYKGAHGIDTAREILDQMPGNNDWRIGAELWLSNREAALNRAKDDGVNYESD